MKGNDIPERPNTASFIVGDIFLSSIPVSIPRLKKKVLKYYNRIISKNFDLQQQRLQSIEPRSSEGYMLDLQ